MFSGAHSCDPAGAPALTQGHTQCPPGALPCSEVGMAIQGRPSALATVPMAQCMGKPSACVRPAPAAQGFPDGLSTSLSHNVQLELTAPNASQE